MFITCEFIPSPSLNGPPNVNNHSIKETTMTLSRKQLVAVAEFQFPFCYLALRMHLKLRMPEKRSAIRQFWIINSGRTNNFLLRRSKGFYHCHVEQHDWVCPADTSLVFLASEFPFPEYIRHLYYCDGLSCTYPTPLTFFQLRFVLDDFFFLPRAHGCASIPFLD